jgi:hypothetical protein
MHHAKEGVHVLRQDAFLPETFRPEIRLGAGDACKERRQQPTLKFASLDGTLKEAEVGPDEGGCQVVVTTI